MSGIDGELEKMFQDCPVLLDKNFQEEHPGIVKTAAFLDSSSQTSYKLTGKFYPFDNLGVKDIASYLKLVVKGNSEAVRLYEKVRDLFGFE